MFFRTRCVCAPRFPVVHTGLHGDGSLRERYYESLGPDVWNGAAYIKARPRPVDLAAGDQFLSVLRPRLSGRQGYLDFAAITGMRIRHWRLCHSRNTKGLGGKFHHGQCQNMTAWGRPAASARIEFFTSNPPVDCAVAGATSDLRVRVTLRRHGCYWPTRKDLRRQYMRAEPFCPTIHEMRIAGQPSEHSGTK